MGIPIGKLICASNQNNVLTDFFESGTYDMNRPFYTTISPSMDILESSNFERFLYYISGEDSERTAGWMKDLKSTGKLTVNEEEFKRVKAICLVLTLVMKKQKRSFNKYTIPMVM